MVLLVSIEGVTLPAFVVYSGLYFGLYDFFKLVLLKTFRYDIAFFVLMESTYWAVESFSRQ